MAITYNPPTGLAYTWVNPLGVNLTWLPPTSNGTGVVPSLLLHMDGTNGSSIFVDVSANNFTVAVTGAVTQTTTNPKFGAASGLFSGGRLNVPLVASGPLDLSAGDFTIEGWVNAGAQGSGEGIIFQTSDGKINVFFNTFTNQLTGSTFGSAIASGPNTFPQGQWNHFALVMRSNTITMYSNGVAGAATSVTPSTITPGTFEFSDASLPFTGRIDEFRVVKGLAVYTASFTPPTAPFQPPVGYDIYRNGVAIATQAPGSSTAYSDTVPIPGTYTYTVAAWDGAQDISLQSAPLSVVVPVTAIGPPNLIIDEAIGGAYFGGVLNLVEFTYLPERNPFLEGATNMIINRYKQEPADVRQRGVDYKFFLAPNEVITNVVLVGISAQGVLQASTNPLVTPLVVATVVIDPLGQKFAYTVSGGQDGIEYTVQFHTTTTLQASNVEEIYSINVLIEDQFP